MGSLLNKWNNMSVEARSALVFMLCTLLVKGIAILVTPIFTRLLTQDEYGLIANYNSWAMVFEIFATLGLTSAGVFNVGMNDFSESREGYISSLIALSNCFTIATFAILIVCYPLMGPYINLPFELIVLMMVHFLFYPAQIYWMTWHRYEYRYRAAVLVSVGSGLISQIASVVAVVFATSNLGTVKLFATELTGLLFCVPLYIGMLVRGRRPFSKQYWMPTLRLSIPLIPHYLSQHVMSASDRIIITAISGIAFAGIYSVAFYANTFVSVVVSAINGSLVPYTYSKLNEGSHGDIERVSRGVLVLIAGTCVVLALLAPEFMSLLAPSSYAQGVYLIPPLVASAYCTALYNLFANIEFYCKASRIIAVATVVASVLNVAACFVLVQHFGYLAAGYALLLSQIALVMFHGFGMSIAAKSSGLKPVYDMRFILLLSALAICACESCCILYSFTLLRFAAIAVAVCVLVINRKRVARLVGSIRGKNV